MNNANIILKNYIAQFEGIQGFAKSWSGGFAAERIGAVQKARKAAIRAGLTNHLTVLRIRKIRCQG